MQLQGAVFVALMLALSQLQASDAQFFTKSASKSIPRMGRRSVQDHPMNSMLRRALIDRLVDEYGPNLLEMLQARAATESSREFAMRNDQPIDGLDSSFVAVGSQDNPEVDGTSGGNMSRNERSPSPAGYQRDNSLAMRALNANRLLQALSSGQPLMSYDRIYLGSSSSDRQDNSRPSSVRDVDANELVMSEKRSYVREPNNNLRIRDARSRLLSDSSDEVPKSILKNRSRIPTKRSVSECVDDLSQIMADLDITLDDLSKVTGKFCPHKHYFDECEEDTCERDNRDEDDDDDDDDDEDDDNHHDENEEDGDADDDDETDFGTKANFKRNDGDQLQNSKQKKCDCNLKPGDTDPYDSKPKKSVRFDEKVYETYFIASRLYDRRNFAKYHSSTRHHPPSSKQQSKKKKNKKSKNPDNKGDHGTSDETSSNCKLSKSQRAKQSKKDKKKRLNRRDEGHETSSDDQGYCSATLHSFSD